MTEAIACTSSDEKNTHRNIWYHISKKQNKIIIRHTILINQCSHLYNIGQDFEFSVVHQDLCDLGEFSNLQVPQNFDMQASEVSEDNSPLLYINFLHFL
jgi:hypothetical protein